MTPFVIAILMATSVNADLFPGGLFPNGLFPNGLFPNGLFPNGVFQNGLNMDMPQITIPPINIPPINIPPINIPPINIPPIPMPKIPTAEEIASLKGNVNGVSITTVNGVTTVVVNKNGVVKKYEIDPNSPDAKKNGASQSSSNVVSTNGSPDGYYQQSSMTFVGGNGEGVANILQNVNGDVTHEVVDF